MGITQILSLLGGLALFLYGMQMMSGGLEDIAGNKMKNILQRLTSNRILGVGVGAGITALIQSSSATTVMTVGFVNSKMMTLRQAVWIIMGANIGTTITGQLIALDVGILAPIFAFFGVALVVFFKKPKAHYIGEILAGLGILFIGMNMMSSAMSPLRNEPAFVNLMTKFSNPVLGILAGAVFTAIIQSSSASIGILQGLAMAGVIGFDSAVYVLFGQNIGTCITAILASIGTNRAAKRTTVIHLLFNLIGTTIFTAACVLIPVTDWVGGLSPADVPKQIANMHTIFNITTTLLLLPFGTYLATLAEKILPEKRQESVTTLGSLTEEFRRGNITLGSTAVHTDLVKNEIKRLLSLAAENTKKAYDAILNGATSEIEGIENSEVIIDNLNKEISQYISATLVNNNSGKSVSDMEQYFLISGNAERVGDHAVNIAGYTNVIAEKEIEFSTIAKDEISLMQKTISDSFEKLLGEKTFENELLGDIANAEQKIDDMTKAYREKHLERMRKGECSEEACILYSELLTDFERIGDHLLNIAQSFAKINA